MGCSSSSEETVDQEKRPGTKPEESNGDTVAVRKGYITKDAQTIEEQMQLPVQTALPGHLQPETDDVSEAILVALEAQEDLGSGEDLLAAPEPQPDPAVFEAQDSEAPGAAPKEVCSEPEAAVVGVEAQPPVDEETLEDMAMPEVKVFVEAKEEAPNVESVAVVQTEATAVNEGVFAVPAETTPAVEPVVSERVETVVAEEGAVNVDTKSSEPGETSQSAPGKAVVPEETSASSEASAPGGAAEPVTDNEIAAATIPEMSPNTSVTTGPQAESYPETEAESVAAELLQVAETPASTTAVSRTPAEIVPEASPAAVTSESIAGSATRAEAPVAEPTPSDTEAPSTPAPAANPASEPLSEVCATDEFQTKKED
uniref:uncharacterized protein LOC109966633 isoform X2 n=1 Tax=Monopterus albus TaxID=43700 RepID=UPI0009B33B30|nr:uncharacterized protein LOC109966633 isoform X2 [Monopterus albus]